MTMVQAGLFENVLLSAESQSRQAKYHRAYRSNPENRNRINSQKKRRRLLKKEKELGNVSCIFESEAAPATNEPQTVEDLSLLDKPSLSDLWSISSWELTDSSRSHYLGDQLSNVQKFGNPGIEPQKRNDIIESKSNNELFQKQVEMILELLRNELGNFKTELRPATQPISSYTTEKQVVSESVKNTDHRTVQNNGNKTKQTLIPLLSAVFLTALTALASWFVAQQTSPLYKSLNIPIPELASYGALVLAISLSGFASIKGSRLAKGFLAVMFCYELLLVIAGTKINQTDLVQEALNANPSYSHAQETLDITKKDYEHKKGRYENEFSKVYQNAWYKKKILDPAYEKYTAATEELTAMNAKLSDHGLTGYIDLILKILFRITAIVVAIMFAESAIMKFRESAKSFSEYDHATNFS